MNIIGLIIKLFYQIFYQPLFNLLIFFVIIMPGHSLGLAIICLTIIVAIILYPFQEKSIEAQLAFKRIQPKLEEIRRKYKKDREKQAKALMQFYKEERFNPFSSFALLLIQLPVLFALYRLFWKGLNFQYLYSFIAKPQTINLVFLGINLSKPNLLLALFVGVAQFFQVKMLTPKNVGKTKAKGQGVMSYFLPAFLIIILLKSPSALGLYLLLNIVLVIIQQTVAKKRLSKKKHASKPETKPN